jgi:hypothetical protein
MNLIYVSILLIIVGTACCAFLLALLRLVRMEWVVVLLLFVLGPICGAALQRSRGGRGILGGVLGGVVSYCSMGIVMYLWDYSSFEGIAPEGMEPLGVFFLLAYWGALVGWGVGIVVWGVMPIQESPHKR